MDAHERFDLEAEHKRLYREAAQFLGQLSVYAGVPDLSLDRARDLHQRMLRVQTQLASLGDVGECDG